MEDDEDRRCIYLVDPSGNSTTFFSYKATLIDVPTLHLELHLKQKSKEELMEKIRKMLVHGISNGSVVVIHNANNQVDLAEFFEGQAYWNPGKIFASPAHFDEKWYRSTMVKPTDEDNFGNKGTLFANSKTQLIYSVSKDIPFDEIPALKGTKKEFRCIKIK